MFRLHSDENLVRCRGSGVSLHIFSNIVGIITIFSLLAVVFSLDWFSSRPLLAFAIIGGSIAGYLIVMTIKEARAERRRLIENSRYQFDMISKYTERAKRETVLKTRIRLMEKALDIAREATSFTYPPGFSKEAEKLRYQLAIDLKVQPVECFVTRAERNRYKGNTSGELDCLRDALFHAKMEGVSDWELEESGVAFIDSCPVTNDLLEKRIEELTRNKKSSGNRS